MYNDIIRWIIIIYIIHIEGIEVDEKLLIGMGMNRLIKNFGLFVIHEAKFAN